MSSKLPGDVYRHAVRITVDRRLKVLVGFGGSQKRRPLEKLSELTQTSNWKAAAFQSKADDCDI